VIYILRSIFYKSQGYRCRTSALILLSYWIVAVVSYFCLGMKNRRRHHHHRSVSQKVQQVVVEKDLDCQMKDTKRETVIKLINKKGKKSYKIGAITSDFNCGGDDQNADGNPDRKLERKSFETDDDCVVNSGEDKIMDFEDV
jgi:hypothetical protein